MIIACISDIILTIIVLVDAIPVSINASVWNCVMHSVFICLICLSLLLWVYQKKVCCKIELNSICMIWGCGDFWMFLCSCCCKEGLYGNAKIEINADGRNLIAQYNQNGQMTLSQ